MMMNLRVLMIAVLPLVTFNAVHAQVPDLEGFWTPQLRDVDGGKVLLDKLPPDAVFIDDAGAGELAEGEYSGLQLSEAARAEIASYDFSEELSREFACTQPSVAFYMQAPFPMEIYQDDELIVFRMEYYDMTRIIHLDGREHPPADAPRSKNGHSTGHWEGDELVVDTTHIASATFMNNGFSHSDNLHLIERFRLSDDGSLLFLTQVSSDPEVFTGLAARFMAWRRVPGEYVFPYECDASFGD